MIKSILVTIDDSPAGIAAKNYAFLYAKKQRAHLSGISIIDTPLITSAEAIPIGGAAFKVDIDASLIKSARQHVTKLDKKFKKECLDHGLEGDIIAVEGLPYLEIEKALTPFDLLIIGSNTDMLAHLPAGGNLSISHLMRSNPRPLIVVEKPFTEPQWSYPVLVAFDGTFASSRSLYMALLMGLLPKNNTHITTIHHDASTAKKINDTAAKLCQNHGISPILHPIQNDERPSHEILKLADKIKPQMIVMGSFGHGGIIRLFTGSCTKDIIRQGPCPLFLYH